MMVKFLMEYRAAKKFPAKGKQFPLLLPSTTLTIFATYCEFSLSIARDMGPFLTLFEATGCIFVQTLNDLVLAIVERFVKQLFSLFKYQM